MKKILLLLSFLLMSVGVWGADATFLPSDFTGQGTESTGSPISATVSTIEFYCNKGYGVNGHWRCYSGSKITISSTNTITSISFTFTDSKTGGMSTSYTGLSTTSWQQTLSSQARITRCVVTYTNAIQVLYSTTFKNYLGVDSIKTQISEGSSIVLPTTMTICNDCYDDNWTLAYWMLSDGTRINSSSHTPVKNDTLYPMYWRVSDRVEEVEEYKKVTQDLSPNWAGDYLIAYSSTVFANGKNGGKDSTYSIGKGGTYITPIDEIDIIEDSIVTIEWGNTYNVTLEEISENSNTYVLKTKDNMYNYHSSNNSDISCTKSIETAAQYPITVNFKSQSDIELSLGGAATGMIFHYNTASPGFFRFYKNGGQQPVYLYKKQKTLKPVGTEYSSIPECDSAYVVVWDSDSLHIDKHRLNTISNPTHITIIDINSGDTLKKHELLSSYYKSSKDEYVIPIILTPNHKLNFLVESTNDSLYLIHKIPFVVKSNKTTSELSDYDDIVIWPENKVTVDGTETTNNNVTVYPNGVLHVPTGTKYTVNSLTLRRDNDDVPNLSYKGTLDITDKLLFEIRADGTDWRWISLPSAFNVSDLDAPDGEVYIKYYDGAYRAEHLKGAWKDATNDMTFESGQGFLFGADLPDRIKKSYFIELDPASLEDEKETYKNDATVKAYGINSGKAANHIGWNIIGNPFFYEYETDLLSPIGLGKMKKDSVDGKWTGGWVALDGPTSNLKYAVIPSKKQTDEVIAAGGYETVLLDDYTLKPFTAFFVQVGGSDENPQDVVFNSSNKTDKMRALLTNNNDDEKEVLLRLRINDLKAGCFISNKYSDEYEPGDDIESNYSLYQNIGGYRLLYSAINDSIIENGVVFNSPKGWLTLDPKVDINDFEYIYVTYNDNWFNLLNNDSVFIEEPNSVFILQAKVKKNGVDVPTDIDEYKATNGTYKFIKDNLIFINNRNKIYTIYGSKIK